MAYGQNKPQGFVPYLNNGIAANPNMQFDENWFICSGYGNNIGQGDLVALAITGGTYNGISNVPGQVINFSDTIMSGTSTASGPVLGVFQGVYYDPPVANVTTYTGGAWTNSWIAGSKTRTGYPARARIIPLSMQWSFSVQSGADVLPPPTQSAPFPLPPGNFITYNFTLQTGSTNVASLNTDGTSTAYVTLSGSKPFSPTGTPPFDSIQFLYWDPNPPTGQSQIALPYGNVIVRLANTSLPNVTV